MWRIFHGMPAECDSAGIFAEMGRAEHDRFRETVEGLDLPSVSRLCQWGSSPHYCASSVGELAEELGVVAKLDGVGGTKVETILAVVKEAERIGVPVSVAGGESAVRAVSSCNVSPLAQGASQAFLQEP